MDEEEKKQELLKEKQYLVYWFQTVLSEDGLKKLERLVEVEKLLDNNK